MQEFVKVATLGDLGEGRAMTVDVQGTAVALFNVGGSVFAIANTCAHRGGPLGEGTLQGSTVVCPWHAFEFDVRTGECRTNPALRVACFEVRLDGQDILLRPGA